MADLCCSVSGGATRSSNLNQIGVGTVFNKLLALCIVSLAVPLSAHAQITPNNSYAQTLVNTNALLQNFTSRTIGLQGQTQRPGGTPSNWCSPTPPADLQRGADGHVPPALQSDPRY